MIIAQILTLVGTISLLFIESNYGLESYSFNFENYKTLGIRVNKLVIETLCIDSGEIEKTSTAARFYWMENLLVETLLCFNLPLKGHI